MKKLITAVVMVFSLASGQDVPENSSLCDESSRGNSILVNIAGFTNDSGEAVLALLIREEWSFPPNPEQAGIIKRPEIDNLAVNAEIASVPYGPTLRWLSTMRTEMEDSTLRTRWLAYPVICLRCSQNRLLLPLKTTALLWMVLPSPSGSS